MENKKEDVIIFRMTICFRCKKGRNKVAYSRHRKGHGIGGVWALRAPIHKRVQSVNLHVYKGQKYCTKCLRVVKHGQSFANHSSPNPILQTR